MDLDGTNVTESETLRLKVDRAALGLAEETHQGVEEGCSPTQLLEVQQSEASSRRQAPTPRRMRSRTPRRPSQLEAEQEADFRRPSAKRRAQERPPVQSDSLPPSGPELQPRNQRRLILRAPSVFNTPPAAQRQLIQIATDIQVTVVLEVEEGSSVRDHDDMFRGAMWASRRGVGVEHIIQEGDVLHIHQEAVLPLAVAQQHPGLFGGGSGSQRDGESGSYDEALHKLQRLQPPVAPKATLRSVLRATPKLSNRVMRAADGEATRQLFVEAQRRLVLQLRGHCDGGDAEDEEKDQVQQPNGRGSRSVSRNASLPPQGRLDGRGSRHRQGDGVGKGKGAVGRSQSRQRAMSAGPSVRSRRHEIAAGEDVYSLLEEDWPCKIKAQLLPGCPGAALANSRKEAQAVVAKLGTDLSGSYVLVSPDKVMGIPEQRQKAMVIPVQITKADGTVTVADTNAFVIQLGSVNMWPYKQQKHLELKKWEPRSVVVGCQWVKQHMKADQWTILQEADDATMREIAGDWIPDDPDKTLVDLFKIRKMGETVDALLRIPFNSMQATLAKSGVDGQFTWPLGVHQSQYAVIWLKQSKLDVESAQEVMATHSEACGLVFKKDQFGIRTQVDKAQQLKTELGMGAAAKYAVKGLPLDAGMDTLLELLDQISWAATPTEQPRSVRAQSSIWFVRSETAPPRDAYAFSVGVMRLSITINPVGGRRPQRPEKQQEWPEKEPTWGCSTQPGAWRSKKVLSFQPSQAAEQHTRDDDSDDLPSLSELDGEEDEKMDGAEQEPAPAKRPRTSLQSVSAASSPQRLRGLRSAWPPLPSAQSGAASQEQVDDIRTKVDTLATQFAQLMNLLQTQHGFHSNAGITGGAENSSQE